MRALDRAFSISPAISLGEPRAFAPSAGLGIGKRFLVLGSWAVRSGKLTGIGRLVPL